MATNIGNRVKTDQTQVEQPRFPNTASELIRTKVGNLDGVEWKCAECDMDIQLGQKYRTVTGDGFGGATSGLGYRRHIVCPRTNR